MKKIVIELIKSYNSAFLILLVAVVGLQTSGMAQTAPQEKIKSESISSTAKRVLADINSRSFSRIKDVRMRKAIEQSYKALKALANNKSSNRESGLMEEFDRTIKNLKSLPQPTGGGTQECDNTYELCIKECTLINGVCKQCGWGQNLCYLNKLAKEATKDPRDPTTF